MSLLQKPLAQNGKSKAEIISDESIRPINGWNISAENMTLSKEFMNSISYPLPITDFAQNVSEVLIDVKNANYISLYYGPFVSSNKQTLVSNGKTSTFNTTSYRSIYIKLLGHFNSPLQGKTYIYHNAKNGFNPTSISEWIQSKLKNMSNFSIVYQTYIKDIGWSEVISDEQKNPIQYGNSISAFRMNFIPTTERQYLIDFWNRDAGTTYIH